MRWNVLLLCLSFHNAHVIISRKKIFVQTSLCKNHSSLPSSPCIAKLIQTWQGTCMSVQLAAARMPLQHAVSSPHCSTFTVNTWEWASTSGSWSPECLELTGSHSHKGTPLKNTLLPTLSGLHAHVLEWCLALWQRLWDSPRQRPVLCGSSEQVQGWDRQTRTLARVCTGWAWWGPHVLQAGCPAAANFQCTDWCPQMKQGPAPYAVLVICPWWKDLLGKLDQMFAEFPDSW